MVEIEPDFGEIPDMNLFFDDDGGCCRCRDVACNVSTTGNVSTGYICCVIFYLIPENISQNANMRQLHDAIANVAKIMFSILCAYRYEIGAIPAIIP